MNPELLSTSEQRLSPWVALRERRYRYKGAGEIQSYHSLCPRDYVNVLAVTVDGRIPMVRQFRPVLERVTLELPGGLIDEGEVPQASALRELTEETGYGRPKTTLPLPALCLDTGRLENRAFGFVMTGVERIGMPEEEVEVSLLTPGALKAAVLEGAVEHAGHLAIIGLAVLAGTISLQ